MSFSLNLIRNLNEYYEDNTFTVSLENSMSDDKQLFLDNVKESILNGDKTYSDFYKINTFASLSPDNYDVDDESEIEVSIETQLEEAGIMFDKVCSNILRDFVSACKETNYFYILEFIGRWRVRDFISFASSRAELYKEDNHRAFAMWQRIVITGLDILTDDMTCVSYHYSKYDKL